jgi:methionyl-tRNA formyltransferase
MGTVNLHGSLLPRYRGAAPINWAIINGEAYTGVTTFKLKHEIDTGDILLNEKITIEPEDNAGTLHDKMKDIGAGLLLRTVTGLAEGTLHEQPQRDADACHAPKIFTDTCRIDWHQAMRSTHNLIRGLSPYPGAFTELDGKKLKIFAAHTEPGSPATPGTHQTDHKHFLRFACNDGYISITDLQLEGKKRMKVEDFLRGYRF